MTDTLIAGEQSTTAADSGVPAEQAAPAAEAAQQATAATEPQADATQASEPEAGEAKEPVGAPETYEAFNMPEGVTLDPEVSSKLIALSKDLNLPQEAAQRVADLGAEMAQKWASDLAAAQEATGEQWAELTRADKEFGGDKLPENLALASKALNQFGSPELKSLLNESRLGNHPEVIRAFVKIGQAISDDRMVVGRTSASVDPAKAMYPNSNHN